MTRWSGTRTSPELNGTGERLSGFFREDRGRQPE
jgi:hypothetical protein